MWMIVSYYWNLEYSSQFSEAFCRSILQLNLWLCALLDVFRSLAPRISFRFCPTQHYIYKFVCTCGSKYIGRTNRCLGVRAKEHVPKWILDGHCRPPRSRELPQSAIARHLLTCGCYVNARENFSVLFSSRHFNILRSLEALAIKRFAPDLCVHKDFVADLLLPW